MAPSQQGRRPCLLLATHLILAVLAATRAAQAQDNWAVIVSSSRYWLNYRHSSNALGVYQAIRRLGIPDRHIILMLADQPACSPRNIYPGQLYLKPGGGSSSSGGSKNLNLESADVEVDYRGREVSVDSVLRVLTGRHPAGTPDSKRLRSGPTSNVLLYMTGHGGDEFLKFHDQEELLAADVASAVHQMHAAGRYGQLLLVADTCQASTLYSLIHAPNVLAVASSKLGQSSYAHFVDTAVGQHIVDQFSFHVYQFLMRLPAPAQATAANNSSGGGDGGGGDGASLAQMLAYVSSQRMSSEVQVRTDLFPRRLADVPVTDFFGAKPAPPLPAASEAGARQSRGVEVDGGEPASVDAQALLLLTAAELGQRPSAAPTTSQPNELSSRSLYEVLVQAAGSSSTSSGTSVAAESQPRQGSEVAAAAAALAATVALCRWLLRKP